ncbi:MAG: VUT family protein, partial [Betaproteobacteria bacterium]|nr:VUT family protein [Betaproteobacteria bacterium]
LFYPLAFWNSGLIPNELIPSLMLSQWLAKTAVEVFFTPVTYKLVAFLKRAEQEDFFDRDTDFTPFQIKT